MLRWTLTGSFILLSLAANFSSAVTIDWVSVGDPGNLEHTVAHRDGTSGYGSVDYIFQIGEFEITNDQYTEFLNAVAASDIYDLYESGMGAQPFYGGILRNGSDGNYSYVVKPNMGNKPVNYVSWFDAARLANWLHNGQPVGMQNSSTTEDGAYTFTDFETAGPRNPGAQYFLPNEHEWQKAAFYEPGAVTNDGDEYWFYGTRSDTKPTGVLADSEGNASNPGPNKIVHSRMSNWNDSTVGNVVTVGSSGSQTYYGAKDMVGNVFEWLEADPNKPDPFEAGPYIVRGGAFSNMGHLFNTERNNGPKIGDGDSDGADFLNWQRQFGIGPTALASADFDDDLDVDSSDLEVWELAYGINDNADGDHSGHIHNKPGPTVGFRLAAPALPFTVSAVVPEPTTLVMALVLIALYNRRL